MYYMYMCVCVCIHLRICNLFIKFSSTTANVICYLSFFIIFLNVHSRDIAKTINSRLKFQLVAHKMRIQYIELIDRIQISIIICVCHPYILMYKNSLSGFPLNISAFPINGKPSGPGSLSPSSNRRRWEILK